MFFRTFFLILLTLSFASFAQESAESEEEAKEKVLKNYASDKDHKLLQKVKDAISDSVDSVKGYISGDEKKPDAKGESKAQPGTNPEAALETEASHTQNSDEATRDEQAELDAQIKTHQISADGKINEDQLAKTLKNLKDNPMLKMLSAEQMQAAAKMMQKNPFGYMQKTAIKKMILAKMDPKKPAGKFVHENPKVVDIAAEWVIDDEAIPAFVSIINQPDKAKTMGIVVLVVFITIFILNLKNSSKSILKRILIKFGLMIGSAVVNFSAFYIIYQKELDPTIRVISKNL